MEKYESFFGGYSYPAIYRSAVIATMNCTSVNPSAKYPSTLLVSSESMLVGDGKVTATEGTKANPRNGMRQIGRAHV